MMGEVHERFGRYQEASEEYKKAFPSPGEKEEGGDGAVIYTCSTCNDETASWAARCHNCGNWNTLQIIL
jgi:hypothetical protein